MKTEAGTEVRRPQAKGPWSPQTGRSREAPPLEPSEGARPYLHLDFGLWPPGLGENIYLLLAITQFVVICYHSPRKLIHLLNASSTSGPLLREWSTCPMPGVEADYSTFTNWLFGVLGILHFQESAQSSGNPVKYEFHFH